MSNLKSVTAHAYECLDVWDLNRLIHLLNLLAAEDRCYVPEPRSRHDLNVYECVAEYPGVRETTRAVIRKMAVIYAA
jgi:hypothetical protein